MCVKQAEESAAHGRFSAILVFFPIPKCHLHQLFKLRIGVTLSASCRRLLLIATLSRPVPPVRR